MKQPIKILITGGAGFIGSHLLDALRFKADFINRRQPWLFSVADIKYRPDECKIKCFKGSKTENNSVFYSRVDLRNFDETWEFFKLVRPDVVYHLAAYFGGMTILESEEHKIVYDNSRINNNIAKAVMRLADETGRKVRFFFSSSQCVYRDQEPGDMPLRESDAWNGPPPNLYGGEKRLAEQVFLAMPRHAQVEVVIARFGNCYGPRGQWDSPQAKAPAALCYKACTAKNGGKLEIYGNGHAVRSYTYIDDLINGILLACPPEGFIYSGEVFNLSSEEYVTVRQLAEMIIGISGKRLNVVSVPGPVGNKARYVSCQKLRERMCLLPFRPLESGLKLLYDWVEEQVQIRQRLSGK